MEFRGRRHLEGRVITKHAESICGYFRVHRDFNNQHGADRPIVVEGVAPQAAEAVLDYLSFNSQKLLQLPTEDTQALADYFDMPAILDELRKRESMASAMKEEMVCSYCRVT